MKNKENQIADIAILIHNCKKAFNKQAEAIEKFVSAANKIKTSDKKKNKD